MWGMLYYLVSRGGKMDEKKNGLAGKLGPQILILPNQEGKHKGKVGEQTKFYIYPFVPIHVMADS